MEDLASAMLHVFSVKTESKQPIVGVSTHLRCAVGIFRNRARGCGAVRVPRKNFDGVVLGRKLLFCYGHGFSQQYVSRTSRPTNDNTGCLCNIEFRRSF
jgi:hypothetical protein